MPETVQSFRPQRSRQKVCSHTNTSPCTLDAEGDAPQLTSKEIRPDAWYASTPAEAFEHPKPHAPGRDPVRENDGYGMPSVDSLAPRGSWIRRPAKKKRRRMREKITR